MKEGYIIRDQEKIHFITGTELYYTLRTQEVTTDTETLAVKRASDGQVLAMDFGDLRANKNTKFYYFAQGKNTGEEYNLTATNEVALTNLPASDNGVTGYQPYQQYIISGVTPSETNGIVYRAIGKKFYELKDHLGNVRVVVSDRKELNTVDNTLTASVVSYNNYYPFGMLQPNRNFNSPEYRYGFQGQEKDSEIKGEGNSINYKYRMHDPRVGRFFAVDPLTARYPHYSPYSFSGNKLIAFVELEGLEEFSFKTHIAMSSENPAIGISSYLYDWYGDKAESKINAAGRGIYTLLENIAPIRPATPEELKRIEDTGGNWEYLKGTPARLVELPSNLYNAFGQYNDIMSNGNIEEKIESSVVVAATVAAIIKGKTPSKVLKNTLQAGFNPKTNIITFIQGTGQAAKNLSIKIPDGFKLFKNKGEDGFKAPVFKKGNEFISPDLDGHKGGVFKKAKGKADNLRNNKTREGTFNADLSIKLGN